MSDQWADMMWGSVSDSTEGNYRGAVRRYVTWFLASGLTNLHALSPVPAMLYLLVLYSDNLKQSSALMFLAGFQLYRLARGSTRLTDNPKWRSIITQALKAFRRRDKVFQMEMPNLDSLLMTVQETSSTEMWIFCFLFWLHVGLALRANEMFLLSRDYIQKSGDTYWPSMAQIYDAKWHQDRSAQESA